MKTTKGAKAGEAAAASDEEDYASLERVVLQQLGRKIEGSCGSRHYCGNAKYIKGSCGSDTTAEVRSKVSHL